VPTDIGVVHVRNHAETGIECWVIPDQLYLRSPAQIFNLMVNGMHTVFEEERKKYEMS